VVSLLPLQPGRDRLAGDPWSPGPGLLPWRAWIQPSRAGGRRS